MSAKLTKGGRRIARDGQRDNLVASHWWPNPSKRCNIAIVRSTAESPPSERRTVPEQPSTGETPNPTIGSDIEELARRLGGVDRLDPAARAKLAGLLRKLAAELDRGEPSAQEELLAESAAQLVRAVQDRHEPRLIAAARERVEETVARA